MSHALLWQKLVNYGIDGKFINIIKSMYCKVFPVLFQMRD